MKIWRRVVLGTYKKKGLLHHRVQSPALSDHHGINPNNKFIILASPLLGHY